MKPCLPWLSFFYQYNNTDQTMYSVHKIRLEKWFGFIVIEPSPLQLCPIFDLHGLCLVTLQYFANIFRSTNCERLGNWDLLNAMTFINTFFVEATKCITRVTTSWNIWMDQSSPDTMSKPTIFLKNIFFLAEWKTLILP